jgi:hypothetical protein
MHRDKKTDVPSPKLQSQRRKSKCPCVNLELGARSQSAHLLTRLLQLASTDWSYEERCVLTDVIV